MPSNATPVVAFRKASFAKIGHLLFFAALGLGVIPPLSSLSFADDSSGDPEQNAPQAWALLIGVEKYEIAAPLQFTVNDVKRVADTLIARGGFDRRRVIQITDRREERAFQPRKESMTAKLKELLAKPRPNDSIIVYFSGHGFRDSDGKMYLAPLDCDPSDPAPTGIPVEWFRNQLAACKAQFKLLILDACHAGSEKGEEPRGIDSHALGESFEDLERVVTIASCKGSEKSLIWPAKEQSLFSYWLDQGLKGHADRDSNGSVDIDELYEFVSRNVKRTADLKFGRNQSPVRIVRTGVDGVPVVLQLRPQSLKGILDDMAEQLAYALEERKFSKIGVLEFLAQNSSGGEELGGQFGLLGKYCAEEMERQLQDRGAGKFSVVDRRRLREALASNRFQLKDLGSSQGLDSIAKSVGGMPVLAVGTLVSRDGKHLRMQCKLHQTGDDTDLGVTTGGTATLNENEWAMLGRSAFVRPDDRRIDLRLTNSQPGGGLIGRLDDSTKGEFSHPYQNPQFQFRVTLTVNDQPRNGEFRGNDYFIPVSKGEKYKLVIENRSGDVAMMRLLVDGLNTLPETRKDAEKGIVTESWGQHVSLDDARPWVLDPKEPGLRGGPAKWTVSGFATKTGTDGNFREFVIVDAQDSLAARQSFTDDIGLITAVFYKASGARGGTLGTAAGDNVKADLSERSGFKVGAQIGIVHLRYIDKQALAATRR